MSGGHFGDLLFVWYTKRGASSVDFTRRPAYYFCMAKSQLLTPHYLMFYCPGCKNNHAVTVNGVLNSKGATWKWNGSLENPTLEPSILCNPEFPQHTCHSFVRDGKIEFLLDCFHELKGQTVALPEVED